jgi:WD40 repeat protein
VATGEEIVRFVPSDGFVFDTQFSPDGKRLLAALTGTQHNRDTVQIWDAHTGQRLLVLQGMNPPASGPPANLYVSFSPDGRRILMLSNYEVSIRDSMTGELICKMETPEETRQPHFFVSTQFSPDGKLVLTEQCNGICRIWNAVTGAQLQTFATVKPSGSDQPYAQPCALFTPDGRGVISGSDEGTAHLWDVGSGKEIRRFHLPGGKGVVTQMIISRDGKRLITVCAEMRSRNTGGSGVFVWDVVWDVELGRVITQLSGDFERLGGERLVGFSPTNEKFITVKDEKPAALWDGATGKIIKRYQPQN